ncbi:8.6 kDa transglutaminase substrate-like isoform X1 [Amblyomma americanum]
MKIAEFYIPILSVAVASVWAYSMPNCSQVKCDPGTCPEKQCSCGTYKDFCGCCDICYKCPGEECILPFNEVCSEGYECAVDNQGSVDFKGQCRPQPAAERGHHA